MDKVKNSFYTLEELEAVGFSKIGKNVKISRKSSFYTPDKMELGDDVRIDDFTILSGKINLGNHVHINPFCFLGGGREGIVLEDFCNVSSRVSIYAVGDDYSGNWMTSPLLPEELTNITHQNVHLGRHCIIGTGSTILPGSQIGEGCAIGAMSLVKSNLQEWGIYVGIPVHLLKARNRTILVLEKKLAEMEESSLRY